jgi:hypothetical protein
MNISIPPVRDALRRLQETEAARSERALLTNFETRLPMADQVSIERSVSRGIKDIEAGRFDEYDADGLRQFARLWRIP